MKALTFSKIFRVLAYIGIILFFWLSTSCTKEVLQAPEPLKTVVFTSWQWGEDYMPHGYPLYCFKGDQIKTKDSIIIFQTNTPDTNFLRHDNVTEAPTSTRRVDSSAVISGTLFVFTGEILHRQYNTVQYIDSIHFANGTIYIRKQGHRQ